MNQTGYTFTGQYSQVDDPLAWNRYAYTLYNPIRYTDPSGHVVASDTKENGCSRRGPACIIKMYTYYNGYDTDDMEASLRGFLTNHPDYIVENDPEVYGQGSEILIRKAQFQVAAEQIRPFDQTLIDELQKSEYTPLLTNKYSPVFFGGISVMATDIQFIALTTEQYGVFAASYLVGRGLGIVSLVSTGYPYQNNLYGTTKADAEIAATTMLVGSIPKPDMAVMTHVGFIYTFLRTFGAIESP